MKPVDFVLLRALQCGCFHSRRGRSPAGSRNTRQAARQRVTWCGFAGGPGAGPVCNSVPGSKRPGNHGAGSDEAAILSG